MPFLLVGVNHKTCHLEVREKFFLQPAERDLLLSEFKHNPKVLGAFILSTCNRTELYVDLLDADPSVVLDVFFNVKKITPSKDLDPFFYVRHEEEAVAHLLRVVTGLDSLILGEKQILGQVKDAVEYAREKKMLNRTLNVLVNIVVETGKKIRRETHIDYGGVSISWAAVTKAQEMAGSLEGKKVLILGSGKMGNLAAQQLRKKGVEKIFVINRTHEKAEELAGACCGTAVPYWQMKEVLEESDVCICATGAPHSIVRRDLVEKVMAAKPGKKIAFIDIAVPRNIDPEVAQVPGVSLLYVDDLAPMVQSNMDKRHGAVELAEAIITAKTQEFYRSLDRAAVYELMRSTGADKEPKVS